MTRIKPRIKLFRKVLLPAMPAIFTGIRMIAVFAFFMMIGAETIGALGSWIPDHAVGSSIVIKYITIKLKKL